MTNEWMGGCVGGGSGHGRQNNRTTSAIKQVLSHRHTNKKKILLFGWRNVVRNIRWMPETTQLSRVISIPFVWFDLNCNEFKLSLWSTLSCVSVWVRVWQNIFIPRNKWRTIESESNKIKHKHPMGGHETILAPTTSFVQFKSHKLVHSDAAIEEMANDSKSTNHSKEAHCRCCGCGNEK